MKKNVCIILLMLFIVNHITISKFLEITISTLIGFSIKFELKD